MTAGDGWSPKYDGQPSRAFEGYRAREEQQRAERHRQQAQDGAKSPDEQGSIAKRAKLPPRGAVVDSPERLEWRIAVATELAAGKTGPELEAITASIRKLEQKLADMRNPKAAAERTAREARDQAQKDQATKDQATKDQAAKDQAAKSQAKKDQATKDQAAKNQAKKDQATRDPATRDGRTKPPTAKSPPGAAPGAPNAQPARPQSQGSAQQPRLNATGVKAVAYAGLNQISINTAAVPLLPRSAASLDAARRAQPQQQARPQQSARTHQPHRAGAQAPQGAPAQQQQPQRNGAQPQRPAQQQQQRTASARPVRSGIS